MNLLSDIISALYFKCIIWFSRVHSTVLRISGGRLMHNLLGLNMLLLSTRGRHTGHCRVNPLLYIEDDGEYYCVASFGGNDRHPQWFINLIADPNVHLLVRRRHLMAIAHVTSGLERSEAWEKLVEYYPTFAKYQRRTQRIIPIVKFCPLSDSRND